MKKLYSLWVKFLNKFRKKKHYLGEYKIYLDGKELGTYKGLWIDENPIYLNTPCTFTATYDKKDQDD